MNDTIRERLCFEAYSFTELDRRKNQLGVVCDGAGWVDFLSVIRETGGVLEAIGMQLRRAGQTHNLSNQFAVLECWYNVAILYPVKGRLDSDSKFCLPDEFIERLTQVAFDKG